MDPNNQSSIKSPINQAQPNQRKANIVTKEPTLKIIPLGGLSEVGKNIMALESGNDIVIIDMGFMFPTDDQPGIDYVIPDTTYLEKNKSKIRGIIITHAHEDHIGGIPYILPKIPAPIFGARFTIGMIEKKLVEFHLQTQPQLRVLDPDKHEKVQLGVFSIEIVRVTHSIPDSCGVIINTPVGVVFHTGDWRNDPQPIDGKHLDLKRLKEIADKGVLMLMSDSTAAERLGRTPGELEVAPAFERIFASAKGRIIISTFASQVNRMQLIIDAAAKTNRRLAFNGRSMLANIELAVKMGYLKVPRGLIVRMQDAVKLPENQIVILCTGSQGEQNSALTRMSTGDHPFVKIKTGDTVVMSSNPIPGNEKTIVATVDLLMREGALVLQNNTRDLDGYGLLHVSGHASRDDLTEMIRLIRPKYFMPIEGEYHMLTRHAKLAEETGMKNHQIFIADNGDVLEFTPSRVKSTAKVPAGLIMIDGSGVGDVEGIVLRDRITIAASGIFVIVALVDKKTGQLISSPDIISRGFIYMKENEKLINETRNEIKKIFAKHNAHQPTDWNQFKLKIRDDISNYLYKRTKRNPMVIPVINEV